MYLALLTKIRGHFVFPSLFAVMAAASIANIVKSSLGPVGLDKMLVDDIGVCFTFNMIFSCVFFFFYYHYFFFTP